MKAPQPLADLSPAVTDGPNDESSSSGIHWSSILGGAAVAAAISLILIPLGSALGFSSFSVFTATAGSAVTFTAGWAIWLVIMQWVSSGVGGYIAGRLRVKWADLHSDEVFFRDTAHGFIAWAVATIFTLGLVASVTMNTVHAGVEAGSTVAAGTAMGAASNDALAYQVDTLYRSNTPSATATTAEVTAETTRIVVTSIKNGAVSPQDKAYLDAQVAARAGISPQEADDRVNAMFTQIDLAKQKAAQAAETARKTAVGVFTVLFLSLLIGAFIASVAAALGGRLRDKY